MSGGGGEDEMVDRDEPVTWGLHPQMWSYANVFARDIQELEPREPFEFGFTGHFVKGSNRPLSNIQLVGWIVDLKQVSETMLRVVIDDSTALLVCAYWPDELQAGSHRVELKKPSMKLGDLVHIHGRLNWFRKHREVRIDALSVIQDPNAEVAHWLRTIRSHLYFDKEHF